MKKRILLFVMLSLVIGLLLGTTVYSAPMYPSFDELTVPQTGCLPPAVNEEYQLMLMSDDTPQKPLTNQKLLTILIEFNDVEIKYGTEFWSKQMFDTTPNALSVVNYWKENSNGLDIFEPANTSKIKDGDNGVVSYEDYTDVKYRIIEHCDGVVRVSLDMPHPVKTWDDGNGAGVYNTISLAVRVIEQGLDLDNEQPYVLAIFAGFDMAISQGAGQGQILGHASLDSIKTSDGTDLGKYAVVGEKLSEDAPGGIGTICHELGHSVFGLPDLYFTIMPYGVADVGMYSLMGLGCWGNRYDGYLDTDLGDQYARNHGHVPAHLDPWCKIKLGYVEPTLVDDWDGEINCISSGGEKSEYKVLEIRSKADPNQYFLVENRQLVGFDRGLEKLNETFRGDTKFNGGIIIWHIDENVYINNNNNSEYHGFMEVEHKKLVWSNYDNMWHYVVASEWFFSNEEGRNKLTAETTPNSNFHEKVGWDSCQEYKDCHPQTIESGISIEVLSESNPSMRVKTMVEEEFKLGAPDRTFSELFPDENFCKAVIDFLEKDDERGRTPDETVSARDWAKISATDGYDMYLDNRGIKDLSGIEHFASIWVIDVSGNELTQLNISSLPNLFMLSCNDNPKLTRLNIENCEALEEIYCNNNSLTELNIKNCTNRICLECQNNLLTDLDLSNCDIRKLYCYNNKLTKLDLSDCPNIYALYCYDNYMNDEPKSAIKGLEKVTANLKEPIHKDDGLARFIYYPQKTAEPSPTPTPTVEPSPTAPPTSTPELRDRVEFEQSGDKVKATMKFNSTTPPDPSDIMLIVAYRENGALKRAEMPLITDMAAELVIPENYKACEIIVYVWDKNMKPLMGAQSIR